MTDNQLEANVLVLRTCNPDMTSHRGFRWPESGPVACTDWSAEPSCGGGLHGLLWGEGDGALLNWSEDARWLVVEVPATSLVDLAGKVKFPAGVVVHCGDRMSSTEFLAANGAPGRAVTGGTATAGDEGTATAGDRGTATAGDMGTATAGDMGTATAGYEGTATAGDMGTLLIRWWDNKAGRYRIACGYTGEDGLKPNTPYRYNGDRFIEATRG